MLRSGGGMTIFLGCSALLSLMENIIILQTKMYILLEIYFNYCIEKM